MKWITEGKLTMWKTVRRCKFEGIPRGLEMVLKGENVGSLVTEIIDEN
jgi:NADPH-dependent curcumin reductase CurA